MRNLRPTGVAAALVACAAIAAVAANPTAPAHSASGAAASESSVPSNQPLRTLGALDNLRIGTAVNTDALASDAPYAQLVGQQFSTVTPENVMKWQVVEPTQGTYDWSAADTLVAYARAHGQLVRGHTLVWHNQLPTWLTDGVANGTIDAAQLRDLLHKHITDEVTHFKGKIWQWDVVNEAFNDDGTPRQDIFTQLLGPGYIADAFRWAHAADPHALLFYNDYNIEGPGAKSDAVLALVTQLRSEGVPINGVGIQGHLGSQYGFWGADAVAANMARFTALGLDTAITEADVRSVLPMDNPKTQAQAEGYSTLLQGCLLTRRCISFTVWGFSDKYQWVPGVFSGQGSAAIYDENFAPKPAYTAMQVDLATAASSRGEDEQ